MVLPIWGSIMVPATLQSACQLPEARPRITVNPMQDEPVSDTLIAAPSDAAASALKRALALKGADADFTFTVAETVAGNLFRLSRGSRVLEIPAPVRLGALLDKARTLASAPAARVLKAGAYRLDLIEKRWFGPDTEERGILLTDREASLLEALILAPGHALERSALLQQVWGYHKDAETHTLETHIYRLRRKIEADAASPQVLLTEGASYRLSL